MVKLSVILPCLNVKNYIEECLDSVINQTLKEIEIIVVDAGSRDGTLEILEDYANKEPNIKIIHSDKKSYGHQVNLGIAAAKGECISIVDTDDVLNVQAYEKLYHCIKTNNLDYVKGYAQMFWTRTDGTRIFADICNFFYADKIEGKVISPCNMQELLVKDHFLWQGIYTKTLLEGVILNETPGAAYQDQGFCLQVFMNARRAMYIDQCVYYYRQDNLDSSTLSHRGFKNTYDEFKLNLKHLEKLDLQWQQYFYARLFDQCMGRFEAMAKSGMYWKEVHTDIVQLQKWLIDAESNGYLGRITPDGREKLEVLKRGAEALYNYCLERREQGIIKFEDMMNTITGNKVVIVSCGVWGKCLFNLIRNSASEIIFGDNNKELWENKIGNCRIASLEELSQRQDAYFVIANKKKEKDLFNQLVSYGVDTDKIIIYDNSMYFDFLQINDL